MDFLTAIEGYWLARRRDFSAHTVADYSNTFKRFARHVGARHLAEINSTDVHKFLNILKTKHKLSDKTLCNYWTGLSSFWTWAEEELHIPHIIRGAVRRPEWRRPEIQPYSKSELFAMLAATEQAAGYRTGTGRRISGKRPTALRDRAILVTLVDTGIRASELCDLLFRDYEQDSGRLMIQHGKGDKKRTVYLGQSGQKCLWKYLASRGAIKTSDPLFTTRTGTPLQRDQLLNMITATAKRAGVSRANVHRFRHTFAISFLRNGGNVLELQRLMGHEKMDTLRIYVELAQLDLANAQQKASPADNWGL